jgi:hypothetical protein
LRLSGLDVARMGSDYSVNTVVDYINDKFRLFDIKDFSKMTTNELEGWSMQMQRQYSSDKIVVDSTGIGAGVYDILRENGLPVIECKFGGTPMNKTLFQNVKAEMYWYARSLFEQKLVELIPHPKLSKLVSELSAMKYEYDSKGKLHIIDPPKSPDYADSFVMACYGIKLSQRKTSAGVVAW